MRRAMMVVGIVVGAVALFGVTGNFASAGDGWSVKASCFDACSCDMFCPCYFNTAPDKDFCKFDNVMQVTSGHLGDVKFDGMKVWMAGDLGGDFKKGMKTMIVYFEPSASKQQVDAMMTVMGKLFPAKFETLKAAPDRKPITFEVQGGGGHAKLGNGDGEITLKGVVGSDGKNVVKIENLRYWGAQKNNGFSLARSTHHFKGEGMEYSFSDASGFITDIEFSGSL